MKPRRKLRIGLALGSGSARGWAHIGVIRALEDNGVVPDIVCGTSIGSLVGAALASGELERLEKWVRSLTWHGVVSFLDFSMNGGLIKGERLFDYFREHFADRGVDQLERRFGAVATELASGREVWLREGSVFDAVRASISLPGLFTPVEYEDRLLVDGGLVNPVPVSMCRALGADVVIAVDLNADLIGRHGSGAGTPLQPTVAEHVPDSLLNRIQAKVAEALSFDSQEHAPSVLDVLAASINIMQVRITRSRLAGEPADVLIAPRLSDFALMDFHRAAHAIEEGERATKSALEQIRSLIS